jgi:hypothetical protein
MRRYRVAGVLAVSGVVMGLGVGMANAAEGTATPGLVTWVPGRVEANRKRAMAGDEALRPAVEKLRREADEWVGRPFEAVTMKPAGVAPSGDAHDYVSVSPYFWPDETDPKAPWRMIDGKTNHEMVEKFDGPRMRRMQQRVVACGLAWAFTGERKYADDAAGQLRAWFIDPATRMTPHMEFAQHWPNKSRGEPWGIIDLNGLPDLVNVAVLLRGSGAWGEADEAGLKEWMGKFSDWLVTSDLGVREGKAPNNHGTFYDLMVVGASRYAGMEARAREVLGRVTERRYHTQVEADGSTPHEQKRVYAAMYTSWNLKGLADLAVAGRNMEPPVELVADDPRKSLERAGEWLAAYVRAPETWGFGDRKFKATNPTEFYWLLRVLTPEDGRWRGLFEGPLAPNPEHRWRLIYGEP